MTYLAALISLGCSYADARPLVVPIKAAAIRYRLDPLLLVAVIAHETRCKNVVARGRGKIKCTRGALKPVAADKGMAAATANVEGTAPAEAPRVLICRRTGCDVGVAQIHVPDCVGARVRRFLQPASGIRQGAKILAMGRARCFAGAGNWYCRRGWWHGRYNPASRRWAASVAAKWRVLRSRYRLPVL